MDLTFGQFLSERTKEKGLTSKKLSEISGIAVKHLESLRRDDASALPPGPYAYGYVHKLGEILEFDAEEWWQRMQNAATRRRISETAERAHAPPAPALRTRLVAAGAIALIALFALISQSPRIFGKPTITLYYPTGTPAVVTEKNITLQGKLENGNELYINGGRVEIQKDGTWEEELVLDPGINPVNITAKKLLGGETAFIQEIVFQAPSSSATSTPGTIPAGTLAPQ